VICAPRDERKLPCALGSAFFMFCRPQQLALCPRSGSNPGPADQESAGPRRFAAAIACSTRAQARVSDPGRARSGSGGTIQRNEQRMSDRPGRVDRWRSWTVRRKARNVSDYPIRYPVAKQKRPASLQAVDLFGCGGPQPDPSTHQRQGRFKPPAAPTALIGESANIAMASSLLSDV
jgi:hypothetical protein